MDWATPTHSNPWASIQFKRHCISVGVRLISGIMCVIVCNYGAAQTLTHAHQLMYIDRYKSLLTHVFTKKDYLYGFHNCVHLFCHRKMCVCVCGCVFFHFGRFIYLVFRTMWLNHNRLNATIPIRLGSARNAFMRLKRCSFYDFCVFSVGRFQTATTVKLHQGTTRTLSHPHTFQSLLLVPTIFPLYSFSHEFLHLKYLIMQ